MLVIFEQYARIIDELARERTRQRLKLQPADGEKILRNVKQSGARDENNIEQRTQNSLMELSLACELESGTELEFCSWVKNSCKGFFPFSACYVLRAGERSDSSEGLNFSATFLLEKFRVFCSINSAKPTRLNLYLMAKN